MPTRVATRPEDRMLLLDGVPFFALHCQCRHLPEGGTWPEMAATGFNCLRHRVFVSVTRPRIPATRPNIPATRWPSSAAPPPAPPPHPTTTPPPHGHMRVYNRHPPTTTDAHRTTLRVSPPATPRRATGTTAARPAPSTSCPPSRSSPASGSALTSGTAPASAPTRPRRPSAAPSCWRRWRSCATTPTCWRTRRTTSRRGGRTRPRRCR